MSWLYEVVSTHVEEIVVTEVSESRGPKSDKLDAFGVAEPSRIGAIKRNVYKNVSDPLRWVIAWDPSASISFVFDAEGRSISMTIHQAEATDMVFTAL